MLRLASFALTLFLLASGCEYNLDAPVSEAEVGAEKTTTAAYASYTKSMDRSAMEAARRAYDIADAITRPLRYSTFSTNQSDRVSISERFRVIDRKARELISAHRGTEVGPPLTLQLSSAMLHSGLRGVSGREALSEEKRTEATLYYLQKLVEYKGTDFERQVRVLKSLASQHPNKVQSLAQEALANLDAFKEALNQPIKIPQWVKEEATAEELKDIRRRAQKSRQGRLQWLRENPVRTQLAALAGQM